MIMSAVVNPQAFLEDKFDSNNKYQDNIFDFLRGIHENGILIDDLDGTIKKQLIKYFQTLPLPKIGSKNKIIFDQLCNPNSPRKFFVLSNTCKTSGEEIDDLIHRVASENKADEEFDENKLLEYIQSEFENKRRYLSNYSKSLHHLSSDEFNDVLIPCIRFSHKLKFYESQLGKKSPNEDHKEKCNRFFKGFDYIINLWKESLCISKNAMSEMEILINTPVSDINNYKYIKKIIYDNISEPIKTKYGLSVSIYLKCDKEKIFHDRFLESDYALIQFSRGFDFFNKKNKYMANTMSLMKFESSKEMSLVRDYRNLPNL